MSAAILESGCGAALDLLLQNEHEQYCIAVMNVLIDFLRFDLVIDDGSVMKALELMMSDEQNVAAVASKFVSAYVLRFPGSVISLTELSLAENATALIRSGLVEVKKTAACILQCILVHGEASAMAKCVTGK
jgi:hypothetical protein